MTDRIHSLTVVLAQDIRDDDADRIIQAINMVRGVLSVQLHVADVVTHMAEERARRKFGDALWEVIYPKVTPYP